MSAWAKAVVWPVGGCVLTNTSNTKVSVEQSLQITRTNDEQRHAQDSNTTQRLQALLVDHLEGGSGLDLVADILTLNDDASFGRIAGAATTMNQES